MKTLLIFGAFLLLTTCSGDAAAGRSPHQLYDDIHNTYNPQKGGEPKVKGGDSDKKDGEGSKDNNGHGNNEDGADVSNPGKAEKPDASGDVDDEKKK